MEYFIYAIPLIVVMLISWVIQVKSSRTLRNMQKIELDITAESAARKLIESENLKTEVKKGTDYTQNIYDEKTEEVLLSPDIFEEKDAMSIGLAALAAGNAVIAKKIPEKVLALKKIKQNTLIVFWLLFTVLAFGLMGKHLPTVIVGYSILAIMILLYFTEIRIKAGINKEIFSRIHSLKIFDDKKAALIKKVIKAETMKL